MEKLTPTDAAKLLHMQQGFSGYSLIKESSAEGGTIGHAIFCPNCATEIALVNVNFLPPQKPLPGSRMAILMDLARSPKAIAADKPRVRLATAPKPVN